MKSFLNKAFVSFMCGVGSIVAGGYVALWNPYAAVATVIVVYVGLFWMLGGHTLK
jgi:hypothetical protein